MASKVAGAVAGKHTVRGPNGRFTKPAPAAVPPPVAAPAAPDQPPPGSPDPAAEPARPSVIGRLLTGSLGDLVRGGR